MRLGELDDRLKGPPPIASRPGSVDQRLQRTIAQNERTTGCSLLRAAVDVRKRVAEALANLAWRREREMLQRQAGRQKREQEVCVVRDVAEVEGECPGQNSGSSASVPRRPIFGCFDSIQAGEC